MVWNRGGGIVGKEGIVISIYCVLFVDGWGSGWYLLVIGLML